MKRAGHLFGQVVRPDNLERAFWKASRGKRARADQRAYAANLGEELARLRQGLLDGTYAVQRPFVLVTREGRRSASSARRRFASACCTMRS